MGQDKGEFLSIRPVGNVGTRSRIMSPHSQGFAGIMVDGPDIRMQRSFPIDIISSQLNLQPPGDKEFEGVVGFV